MSKRTPSRFLFLAFAALAFAALACSFGSGGDAEPTAQATVAQIPSGIGNPSVPFEAVVQIWAMYEDESGELQIGWTGSGTIISPDGLILTNAHVVLPDRYFPVDALVVAMTELQDVEPDPVFYAEVLQADANLDIAVIQVTQDMDNNSVSGLNLPFVPLGNSDTLNLGDNITILGYPGIGGDTVTLTRGEVSGFTSQPEYGQRAFIKTSATIAGGNSGGLALDNAGNLVGVPTQLGYGGDDQFVDCRVLADTNRDGFVDDLDSCVPTGGFINALRPVKLALPFIEAAQRGEVAIVGGEEPAAQQPVPVSEPLSLTDDFTDESSGWDVFTADWGAAFYSNDEYFLQDVADDSTTLGVFYPNYGDFGDTVMSIDVRTLDTVGDNEVSVMCRFIDSSNFYEFRYQEGYYSIGKFEDNEYTLLLDWVEAPEVQIELATAELNASCIGDELSMGVNGHELVSVNDSTFVSGKVGVTATNWEGDQYTVAFDNLVLDVEPQGGGQASTSDTLYFDDFSNDNSGWTVASDSEVASVYEDGMYQMSVFPDNYWYWSVSGREFDNVVMNVDVNITGAAGDGDFGLLCRYVDADNFYALEVSEDGYYSIWKKSGGEVLTLVEWQPSSLIPTDGSPFTVNASCNGAQLLLGVNAELVAEATDSDFSSGDVGMIVGTWTLTNLTIGFDNFEVLEP